MNFIFDPPYKILVTTMLFLTYSFTIAENSTLIAIIQLEVSLRTPMYFFLGNFSFLECCFTTIVIPKTLYILITDNRNILCSSCIVQLYIFTSLGATECLLLATMAYDRFTAICYPLYYMIMINRNVCILLVFSSWVIGFLSPLLPAIFISQIHFCSYRLNHFFCDVPPILQLACSSTRHIELTVSLVSSVILMSSFIVIAVSYSRIAWTITAMQSKSGFQKAISTCASHLTVVFIYYGSGMYMYVRPNSHETLETNKLVALLYSVLTPILNPLIYSFRNNDVNVAFKRWFQFSLKR
ncbi:hypothetical protein GDO81_002094 [Engystomops pustulosus]|uniref:Olfactory receptor n=1 Tax=Engystomops pustulosus TaxID=76066 RepID=A0AAV7DK35_ENGPU|nr:hypothetical protein GDO81_002094 [Engystomops pustulosus]